MRGPPRLRLVRNPKVVSLKLSTETDKSIEMLAAQFDVYKSDLAEAALRLLLEVLENPGVIDVEKLRDGELREFLARLVERRENVRVVTVA